MNDTKIWSGGCHCGAVRFTVKLAQGLASARRCDCSICRMKGYVALTARVGDLELLQGTEALRVYTFHTHAAQHYFCGTCGIHTHHRRRSNPDEHGINAACLEGVSPFDFAEIEVLDGVNHPNDSGKDRVAGMLRFERR